MKPETAWIMYDPDRRVEAIIGDLDFVRNMKSLVKFIEPEGKFGNAWADLNNGKRYRLVEVPIFWPKDKDESR